MAPPKVAATEHRTSIHPRVASPQPPQAQATRVTNTTNHLEVTKPAPYKLRHRPQAHMPPQVTQEERAYQLMATALPNIESAHSVTCVETGQHLEYHVCARVFLSSQAGCRGSHHDAAITQGRFEVMGRRSLHGSPVRDESIAFQEHVQAKALARTESSPTTNSVGVPHVS
jgi:hypothetical protein